MANAQKKTSLPAPSKGRKKHPFRQETTQPTRQSKLLLGKVREVSAQLNKAKLENVVAMTFKADEEAALALFEVLSDILPHYLERYRTMKRDKFLKIVEALLPESTFSQEDLAEAEMRSKAIQHIWESTTWLSAAQIGKEAGFSLSNPSTQPNRWKKSLKIFALTRKGRDFFPGYALDSTFRPLPVIKEIIEIFGETKDSWGLAFWLSSANSFLGGQRPQDLLSESPSEVLEAARDEIMGVLHG